MLQSRSTESSIPCWIMPTVVVAEGEPRGTSRDPEESWTDLAASLQCVPYMSTIRIRVFLV